MSNEAQRPVRRRFTILPGLYGFEVIDADGRPVDRRETRKSANGAAQYLNEAAMRGTKSLERALRCSH